MTESLFPAARSSSPTCPERQHCNNAPDLIRFRLRLTGRPFCGPQRYLPQHVDRLSVMSPLCQFRFLRNMHLISAFVDAGAYQPISITQAATEYEMSCSPRL